ncbi:MAG: hypothetical protein HY744_30850, partial [Deltaproteobacteria bacterium]|nr:hypothetical protein [Deltaproteobacteria bacterium]
DLASWEGLRDVSRKLGDWRNCGVCCARLGSLCRDEQRAAAFWEEAGLVLLEHTDAHEDAEIALERALKRSPRRAVAFDKLFRRVRERKDHDRLLHLIEQRLQVSESDAELTKMYWERARALRSKGEAAAALRALGDVMLLEPDHVGALALEGEIRIARGELDLAAPPLARLASLDSAPVQQRLVSGLAAADLYDKKLGQPEKAVAVLVRLHEAGLCTQQVRERLARSAAAVGSWAEAARILEELMVERETSEGRIEAANLALVIYRDKLALPARAEAAVRQLLEEQPDHAEALALALGTPLSAELRAKAIPAAREVVLQRLAQEPFDPVRVEVLGQIADARGELALRAAALGVLVALGDEREALQAELGELLARAEHVPQAVLDASGIAEIAHPEDSGPVSELMVRLADAVGEALGPSLKTEGVGKRDRIEAHDDPLRRAVASWMGALGFESDFDLYVTQRDALRVRGIAAERPTLVVGSAIAAPFDAATRAAVAREIFALRCGTTLVLHHDSHTVASVAIAASNAADVSLPEPKFAVYREIARAMDKALSRKLRRAISEICQKAKEAGQDPVRWAVAAQHSIDRMAAIAAGAPAAVLDQIAGPPGSPGRKAARSNDRARHLLAFVLSPAYVALRDRFGMGVG